MVKQDNIAQWLAGDELKRDQFKFIYNSMKVINDSCLKDYLINEDKKVMTLVVPYLAAYHALLKKMDIIEAKNNDRKKEQEKQERENRRVTFMQEQPEIEEDKKNEEEEKKDASPGKNPKPHPSQKLSASITSNFSEHQMEKERERLDIE